MTPPAAERTNIVWHPLAPTRGVVVLHGFGVRLSVEAGSLIVDGGIGLDRYRGQFHPSEVWRGPRRLDRLVVRGHSGSVSLEALSWCREHGVAVVFLDAAGEFQGVLPARLRDDARLRRAQVIAGLPGAPAGFTLAQELIGAKVAGEARLADLGITGAPIPLMAAARDSLERARTVEDVGVAESASAAAFYDALADIPVPWLTRDQARIPDGWRRIGPRHSGPHRRSQHTLHPVHAILNVCFTGALTEAVIACHALALDPGLGLLHTDEPNRPSLACDVMEPARPIIAQYVLETMARRHLRLSHLRLRPDGEVRLRPAVLAEWWAESPRWRSSVFEWAERAEDTFARVAGVQATTPLTSSRARAVRDASKGYTIPSQAPAHRELSRPRPTCRECGVVVHTGRVRCPECHAVWREANASRIGTEAVVKRWTADREYRAR